MPESTKLVKTDVKSIQIQTNNVLELLQKAMTEGVDYGTIPGTQGKSLFASGADKLAKFLRVAPRFHTEAAIEDFDQGLFYYRVKCTLVDYDTQHEVGDAIKICHSKEKKYRIAYGKPAAKEDVFDKVNTILSMAEKRAFVAAIRTYGLGREIFKESFEVDEVTGEILSAEEEDDEKSQTMKRLFVTAAERGFEGEAIKTIAKKKWPVAHMNELSISQLQALDEWLLKSWRVVGRGHTAERLEAPKEAVVDSPVEPAIEVYGQTDLTEEEIVQVVNEPLQGEVTKDTSLHEGETVKPSPKFRTCAKCKKQLPVEEMANNMFCKACKLQVGKQAVEAEEV